jgi:hypothetical protein
VRVFKNGSGVRGMSLMTGGGVFPGAITKVTFEIEDDALVLSVRVIPIEYVPAVVGVPLITPDPLRDSPGGRDPLDTVVVSVATPEL